MVTEQPINFGLLDTTNNAATEFFNIVANNGSLHADRWKRSTVVPTAGKFTELHIDINTAISTGSWELALNINGTKSTTLTLTFDDATTSKSIVADQSISAGDVISLEVIPTSTPTNFTAADCCLIWVPTTEQEYIILMGTGATTGGSDRYNYFQGGSAWTVTEADRKSYFPQGTITKFVGVMETAGGGSSTQRFVVRKNGSDTVLDQTLDSTTTTWTDSSTVSVADGDYLTVLRAITNAPANSQCHYACVFIPDFWGRIPAACGNFDDELNNAATEYNSPFRGLSWTGTKSNATTKILGRDITFKHCRGNLLVAPGSGKSWDIGYEDPANHNNFTMTNTDTSIQVWESYDVPIGTNLALKVVPTSTPAASDLFWTSYFMVKPKTRMVSY